MYIWPTFALIVYWCSFQQGASGVETHSVPLMEGDSVTLHTRIYTSQEDRVTWYFNENRIAMISGGVSKICTDVQCDGRFRDKLYLDHQTGSLTITNITTEHTGDYKMIFSSSSNNSETIFTLSVNDGVKKKSVKEGESVKLDPGGIKQLKDLMSWLFKEIHIAEMTGDQSQICTDDECKERFRDRLEVDHQTGSLTITNTRTEDSGEYALQINNSIYSIIKTYSVTVTAVKTEALKSVVVVCIIIILLLAGAGVIYCSWKHFKKQTLESVSVTEGGFVPLKTNFPKLNAHDRVVWTFKNNVIVKIHGDTRQIDADVLDERFRDRLELDDETGSLTITNIRSTDSGVYQVQTNGKNKYFKEFIVTVFDEVITVTVSNGESVFLKTNLELQNDDQISWKFEDCLIAKMRREIGKIPSLDVADGRFRDRLKLDEHTGSLTIINTTTNDSGKYQLRIKSNVDVSMKLFTVSVVGSTANRRNVLEETYVPLTSDS